MNKGELNDIQTAMNSGIRAVFGLRRFGHDGISNLRKSLKIPSIFEISEFVVRKAAWEKRGFFLKEETAGPVTRSRSKMNIPLRDERGWSGKLSSSVLARAWNDLSVGMKTCTNALQLKFLLKKNISKFD